MNAFLVLALSLCLSSAAFAGTISLDDHLKDNAVTIQIDKFNGSYIYSEDATATCSALGFLGGSVGSSTKSVTVGQYDTVLFPIQYMGFGARFYPRIPLTVSGEDAYKGKVVCSGSNCTLKAFDSVTCLKLQVGK